MPACNGCGKSIAFVATPAGKKIPVNTEVLDVVVEKGGPLRVVLDDGRVVAARLAAEGELQANVDRDEGPRVVIGRTSHFADCPRADRFRAKGRTAP